MCVCLCVCARLSVYIYTHMMYDISMYTCCSTGRLCALETATQTIARSKPGHFYFVNRVGDPGDQSAVNHSSLDEFP